MTQGDQTSGQPGELFRPFDLRELGDRPVRRSLEAEAGELAALAERFDLIELERLQADLVLRRLRGGIVRVEGQLRAAAKQRCVVTLGPVPVTLDEPFDLEFQQVAGGTEAGPELDVELEAPEPLEGGRLDLGELVAQQFSLALDPYPRAPGVTLEEAGWSGSDDEEVPSDNPFAALGKLKDRGRI